MIFETQVEGAIPIHVDDNNPSRVLYIKESLTLAEREKLRTYLSRSKNVFGWSVVILGINRDIITHSLNVKN